MIDLEEVLLELLDRGEIPSSRVVEMAKEIRQLRARPTIAEHKQLKERNEQLRSQLRGGD